MLWRSHLANKLVQRQGSLKIREKKDSSHSVIFFSNSCVCLDAKVGHPKLAKNFKTSIMNAQVQILLILAENILEGLKQSSKVKFCQKLIPKSQGF